MSEKKVFHISEKLKTPFTIVQLNYEAKEQADLFEEGSVWVVRIVDKDIETRTFGILLQRVDDVNKKE